MKPETKKLIAREVIIFTVTLVLIPVLVFISEVGDFKKGALVGLPLICVYPARLLYYAVRWAIQTLKQP